MIPASRRLGRLALTGTLLLGCKPGSQDGVALVGATLIDGSGGPALPDAAVVVRGGRIESIGFAGRLPTSQENSRGRRFRAVDHPGTDRRPRPPGTRRVLGTAPLSGLGRDHRSGRARRDGLAVHAEETVPPGAPEGPRVYPAGAMIDGLPATYPDAIGVNNENDGQEGCGPAGQRWGRLHKGLHPHRPATPSGNCGRGTRFQSRRDRPPRHDRRRDRGQGRHRLDRAPDWRPGGRLTQPVVVVHRSLPRLLPRVDGIRAELGRPGFGGADAGGEPAG